MKNNNSKGSLIVALFLAVVMYGCSDAVGTIEYTTPPVVPGERVLSIKVENPAGQPVTGYDLSIAGPTTASVSNVGSATYNFSNLNSGEYTITATRSGYVEGAVREQIELPADISSNFRGEVKVVLTPRAPAQPVSNASGATIQTAPAPGSAQATITLNIPPNAFPASALDASGNVNVGLSRAKAGATTTTSQEGSTPSDIFDFEPSGVTLNIPIEAALELDIPANLNLATTQLTLEGQDGAIIQLVPDGSTASKTFVNEDGELMATRRFVFSINRLQRYALIVPIRITTTSGWTNFRNVASSPSCGAGVNAVYNFSRGVLNTLQLNYMTSFTNFPLSDLNINPNYSDSYTVEGVQGVRSVVSARNRTQTRSFVQGSTTLASFTFNVNTVEFRVTTTNCHNSGGN